MKKHLRRHLTGVFLLLAFVLASTVSQASHIYGADLFYTWQSGNIYKVTLVLYGDCQGSSFPTLINAQPRVEVRNGNTLLTTMTLLLQPGSEEVTPVCPAQAANTVCTNPLSTTPGVFQYTYSANVTLNAQSANWLFRFNGILHPTQPYSAGRATNITNIQNPTNSVMRLEATLNNTAAVGGNNSSAIFTVIPTPFFCINKPGNYNPGSVDPNLDSLAFALTPGLQQTAGNVTYIAPATATAPLATSPGSFSFSTTTGQLAFTPNAGQQSLVVNRISEYRNGVLVGTCMREMTFVVLTTCNNNPPGGNISNPSTNGVVTNNVDITACKSSGLLTFNINPTDADGDNIIMGWSGIPAGATFTVTNNFTTNPVGYFSWNLATAIPGTYTFFVTYTDEGCPLSSKQTLAYTVTVIPDPSISFLVNAQATCVAKAVYTLTPMNAPPWTVQIKQGATVIQTTTGVAVSMTDSLLPGTYTFTVTNTNGCFKDTTITLAAPTLPTPGIVVTQPLCIGSANGSITASGSGTLAPYQYALGAGAFSGTATFTGLTAGTYTIRVRDNNGCIKDTSVTLSNPAPIYANVSIAEPPCNNFSNGSFTASGYNSVAPYTYAVGAGGYQASGAFAGLPAGSYTLHIKNSNGCIKDTVVVVPDSLKIAATISPLTNVLCNGGSTGTATINASGTVAPYTYAVGSGPFGPSNTFTGLGAGTHILRVKDVYGCFFDTTITITQPTPVTALGNITANPACNGIPTGSATVTGGGGTPGYTYNVNGGAFGASNSFTGLAAGTNTLGVKDNNGCVTTVAIILNQPPPITVGWTATMPSCFGGANGTFTVTGSGGTPGYTYAIDGGAFGASGTFTGLSGGTHTLRVKDAANCIKDSVVNLLQPSSVSVSAGVIKSVCNTLGNGQIALTGSGGTPGYTYAIGAGAYAASGVFTPLAAGTYTLHVRDANACQKDTTITVADSLTITGTITRVNALCNGTSTGSITVAGAGGQSAYTYAINAGPFGASGLFSTLAAGTYTISVKDANGCIKDTNIIISQPSVLGTTASKTNVLCNGGSTGTITVAGNSGTPAYTYALNAGAYGASGSFTGLIAGSYTVHTKDNNGCIKDTVLIIGQPPALTFSQVLANILCNGNPTGSITINAAGGTPGYTYSVDASPYGVSNVFSGLTAGVHTVSFRDQNNCQKDTSVNLSQPSVITPSAVVTNVVCNAGTNGVLAVTGGGGTPGYTYALGAGPYGASGTFNGLAAGTYTVHIKDASNCIKDTILSITQPAVITITTAITNVPCNGGTGSVAITTTTGGTAGYTYTIDGGTFTAATTLSGLAAGPHTITVKDASNCTKDFAINITQPTVLGVTGSVVNVVCNGGNNGSLTVAGNGGTPGYTYAIGAGTYGASGTFTGLGPGIYTLHTKDANGCIKDTVMSVVSPSTLAYTLAVTGVSCNGGNNGSVTVTATGGTTPYTYAVDAGAFSVSNLLSGLTGGVHTIRAKDGAGCIKDSLVTVPQPPVIVPAVSAVNIPCFGQANGTLTLSGSGGTPGYTYAIGAGLYGASGSFTGLAAGTFVLHIKDANGCIKDTSVTISQQPKIAFTFAVTQVGCNGNATGAVTVTASGGTPGYTYASNGGAFGASNALTGLSAGTNTISVKDNAGCQKDSVITITQPTVLGVTGSVVNVVCNGGNNGSITVAGNGGTPGYTYAIGAGTYGASGTFTGLGPGIYTIHTKDANGCIKDTVMSVVSPSTLAYTLAVTGVTCNGGNNGSVTISATGGTPPYTYAVDAGAFGVSNILSGLTGGVHTIRAKDGAGCIKDSLVTVPQPPVIVPAVSAVNIPCFGQANGTLTLSATGGTPGYTYAIGAGLYGASGSFTGLAAGTFVLHSKDANGCIKDTSVTISQQPKIAFTFAVTQVGCNGNATGAVTVTATGGTPGYTYASNGGAFGASNALTGLSAGTNTISVKDNAGCQKDSVITITQPTLLGITATKANVLCSGGNTGSITGTANGGTPGYTYAINAGTYAASGAFTALTAGTYILHAKDANGCIKDTSITITQPTPLAYTLSLTNLLCNGAFTGSVTVTGTGGVTTYTYAVDGGAYSAGNTLGSLAAGTHIISMKDANGCIKDTTVTLTQPPAIVPTVTLTQPSCNGGFNGTATIAVTGGTPGYTYSIGAGPYGASGTFNNLPAGLYALHAKDANGCVKDTVVTLTQPTAPAYTLALSPVLCNGGSTGSVTVTGSGGTPGYTYAADAGAFGASNVLTGLNAGPHTINMKDNNGCIKDSIITILQPTAIKPAVVRTNVSCGGYSDGSLLLSASGGTAGYTYAIGAGLYGASGSFGGLIAGTYTLHVKDANNCIKDTIVTITQPSPIAFTIAISNVSCFGGSNGSATVTATGATPPYTYAVNATAFGISNVLGGLPPGTHAVHVKDNNGCQKDSNVTITQPTRVSLTYVATQPACTGNNNGSLAVTGTGGTPGYTYAIGAGPYGASGTFGTLTAGTYTVHVKDNNGCIRDSVITLAQPTPVTVAAVVARPRCTPLVNGAVTLTGGGGTPGYTYAVNALAYQASPTFNTLGSGTYIFHVKDTKGCIKDTTIVMTDSLAVTAQVTVVNAKCFNEASGAISIVPGGGVAPYTYSVNNGPYSATNPVSNLAAGTYTVFTKDDIGCRKDTTVTITQPTVIIPSVNVIQPLCFGGVGTLQIVAIGGTPGYFYAIGTGNFAPGNTFGNLVAGTYTLRVRDNNLCIKDTIVTMGQPTPVVVDSVRLTDVFCFAGSDGTATIFAHGGTLPYTYAADANTYAASSVITNLNAGAHILHTKDANGCIKDTTITIIQPTRLSFLPPVITPPTCEGFRDGSIAVYGIGGKPWIYGYQYSPDNVIWKTVSFYDNLGEGSYTFYVKDSNNCVRDTTIEIKGYPHIDLSASVISNVSCFGRADGAITTVVLGGVPPFTYAMVPKLPAAPQPSPDGVYDSLKAGLYTIRVQDSKGCIKDTAFRLTQPDSLSVKAVSTPNDCIGLDSGGTVTAIATGGTGPYEYTWSTQPGQSGETITGLTNGAYTVMVTDLNGCTDTQRVAIAYDNCCTPFVPDAFTPNGDGINDLFRIRYKGDISDLEFSVMNRFGERVFITRTIGDGWNGTYHGAPADVGTYFYYVTFICGNGGDKRVEYKGDVTLIR